MCTSSRNDTADFSAAKNKDTVGKFQQHVQILAHVDNSHSGRFLLVDQIINGIGRVYIQSPDGVSGEKHRGGGSDLPAHQDLLYVAAGQPPNGSADTRGADIQLIDDGLRESPRGLSVGDHAAARAEGAQHHVVRQIHVAHQAHAEAILRNEGEGDAHFGDLHGIFPQQLFPGTVVLDIGDASALHRLEPRNGFQQLFLPAAGNTRDPQDLTAVGGKRYVFQLQDPINASDGQPFDLDSRFGIHGIETVDVQRYGVPHHHVGHFLCVGVFGEHIAYELAVTKDGDPVGEGLDLVHLVCDDDNGLAVVAHVAQHRKELVGLLGRQHGGGLIQDQDVGASVQNLYNLDSLLLRDGHIIDLLIRVHLKAVSIADRTDPFGGSFQIQLSLQPENDIFSGRQYVHQLEMLMDHADAVVEGVLGGADDNFLVVNEDLTIVREIYPGEHIHQGSFAAAVLTQKRQDLTAVNIQPDLVVGDDASEPFGDIAHLDSCHTVFQCVHSLSVESINSNTAKGSAAAFSVTALPFTALGGREVPVERDFPINEISTSDPAE